MYNQPKRVMTGQLLLTLTEEEIFSHGPCITDICGQYTCADSWALMEEDAT